MRTNHLSLATLVLAAPVAGCTAIADPGQYVQDPGCDLRMDFLGMSAHTSQRTHLYVDSPTDATFEGVGLTCHVVLDPTPAPDFSIRLPEGVISHRSKVDFYSDVNDNGTYDGALDPATNPGGDHTWVRSGLCEAEPLAFSHVFVFDDFTIPSGRPNAATVHFVGFPASTGPVEVRVFQRDADLGDVSIGLYHKTSTGSTGTFDVVIDGIVDASTDLDLRVEVWVDRNANGAVDPGGPDVAFTKTVQSNVLGGTAGLVLDFAALGTVGPYDGTGPYVTTN